MKSIYSITAGRIKKSFVLTELVKIVLFIGILMLLFAASKSFGQTPGYVLTLTNDQQVSASVYEFDIYLLRTGANTFEYANNSQYFMNINPAIINGGSIVFTIITGTCELNGVQQILTSRVSFDAVNSRLRIAAHSPSGAGTGTIIANSGLGTKLGRFRVTNSVPFASAQTNLSWYNGPTGFFTKVFAYVAGNNVEITVALNHVINISNPPLPVILTEFNYSVSHNIVSLKWKTQSETNNSGFDVERRSTPLNPPGGGTSSWAKIGFVQGSGTTSEPKTYSFDDRKLKSGNYNYRLKQTDYNGNFQYFNLQGDVIIGNPKEFNISQNFPNPSNPKSKIDYELPGTAKVMIKVYDILGKEIITLVNESKEAGYYTTEFDGSDLASGVYLYHIAAEGNGLSFTKTMKMVLIK